MLRRETPVWANAFACCGGEAEAGFPDPLKAQQTNYNLHKSGILRSSACGEGISFATANELSCLNTNPLHCTSLRSWKCRKHKAFDSCFQPGGSGWQTGTVSCPARRTPQTWIRKSSQPRCQGHLWEVSGMAHGSSSHLGHASCHRYLLLKSLPCLPIRQIPSVATKVP